MLAIAVPGSLPNRQLRKESYNNQELEDRSLPNRQLRNHIIFVGFCFICSLPNRQLRKAFPPPL